MDRALKERTIGAVVLVAFAVLVVPVFLDGPSDDPAVLTEAVTLPGQGDGPRERQTIVLEVDRDEPVPVPAGDEGNAAGEDPPAPDAARRPAPDPVPAAAESAAPAAPQKSAAVAPAAKEPEVPADKQAAQESASGLWAVQLGSFSSRENAERLAAGLRDDGYAAFLSKLDTSEGALHRVRIGPQADRDSAEKVAVTLAGAGHKGQVVPHP